MLSAIIIAKNEEKIISRAIQSVSFCDEVLVIDNHSQDNSSTIAKAAGARVITSTIDSDFAALRNFAMQQAAHDWVLFIDADEVVSNDLRIHIKHELEHPGYTSYYLRRRDHFMGHILTHGEVATVYERGIIRLMKKGSGTWEGTIHEEWSTHDDVGGIDGFIEHYPHPSIHEFLESINSYSTVRSQELLSSGKRTGVFELIAFPCGKFLYTYFLKSGYRDGAAGFIYSFMMSFHSFLVRAKSCNV